MPDSAKAIVEIGHAGAAPPRNFRTGESLRIVLEAGNYEKKGEQNED